MTREGLSRRHALTGAATVGLGGLLLAACGDDGGETASDPTSAAEESSPGGGATSGGGGGGGGGGDALTTTSDIEVGGGTIFGEEQVVVTQPSAGDFKAFTAVCTHQGCIVNDVSDGTINCACHGSQFSIEDGSVQGGPAPAPLEEFGLDVQGNNINLA